MALYLHPGHGKGSVEHFYHFLFEYLLPLYERNLTIGITERDFIVQDCGPMNGWLDFVFGTNAFSIVSPEKFAEGRSRRLWDKHIKLEAFASQRGLEIDASRFNEVVTAFRSQFLPPQSPPDTITVIDRRPPPAFYLDGRAKNPGGGSTRRSIGNLSELVSAITTQNPVRLVDLWDMTPADQLEVISRTAVLIGQHGAGLAHSIFMHENATLVELKPEKRSNHFLNLSRDLGRKYGSFFLDSEHTTLSTSLIRDVSAYVSEEL